MFIRFSPRLDDTPLIRGFWTEPTIEPNKSTLVSRPFAQHSEQGSHYNRTSYGVRFRISFENSFPLAARSKPVTVVKNIGVVLVAILLVWNDAASF